ncbi:MAG TPA: MFS transporter [Actinoplanes sp.]|nr:MFS transporter [Actinoplanes sp.]
MTEPRPPAIGPLGIPAFRLLVAGRAVAALGNAIAPVALAFAVLDLTGSATDLGLVVATRMLANVAFVLFGGALADRLPKHLLMVGAGVAAAASQGVVAALVLTGNATVTLLIVLSAVNGMASALELPASSAILPQIVPPDLRQRANGINRLLFNGAFVVGAPVGGVLVAATSPGWGIAADAVAFLLSAVCFAFVRVPTPAPADHAVAASAAEAANKVAVPERAVGAEAGTQAESPAPAETHNLFTDLRIGWTEFRTRTWLWVVVVGFCLVNAALMGGFTVLGPVIADRTIGREAWGFVLGAQTAGMMIGALVAMRIRVPRLLLFGVVCTAALVLPILGLGLAPHFWLLWVTAFVAGASIEQFGVAWETTMQEHVPADKLARVYSYDMMGSFVAIPVGQVAAGPIADAVGVEATLIGAAALILVAVLGMLSSRDVRHLRHRLPDRRSTPMEQLPA